MESMIIVDPNMDKDISDIVTTAAEVCTNLFNLYDKEVLITFNGEASEGYEAVTIPGEDGRFLIALNPDKKWDEEEIVKTIGHEYTHVKQFTYNGLDIEFEDMALFKGSEYRFENDMEYWLSPWEIEARGHEVAVWLLYIGKTE